MSDTERLSPTTQVNPVDSETERERAHTFLGGGLRLGERVEVATIESRLKTRSGEAEIYLAKLDDGSPCIVKYYFPSFSPNHTVLKSLGNLEHEDLVRNFGYGEHEGRFFEIMEYAAGGTLGDKDEATGAFKHLPLDEKKAESCVRQILSALVYAHGRGVVHRDLKPDNIFIRDQKSWDICLGDFGISSALDTDMSKRMTTTSRTEGFAAPEIYAGLIGPEVDYYAMGITLYLLLTGDDPFAARNQMHIMRDTIQGRVIDDLITREGMKSVGPRTRSLLQGLLTVRHDKRWGAPQVEKWLSGETVEVFAEQATAIPPIKFAGRVISSVEELAAACRQDPKAAEKALYRGYFEQWATSFDQDLASQLGDIRETVEAEVAVPQLLFLLDVTAPLQIDGAEIRNLEDFREFLTANHADLAEALRDDTGSLHAWMRARGMKALSAEIAALAEQLDDDFDLVNRLRLVMAGGVVRPFTDIDLQLASLNDLMQLPATLGHRVIDAIRDPQHVLRTWLAMTMHEEQAAAWHSGDISHNWPNLKAIVAGKARQRRITRQGLTKEIYVLMDSHGIDASDPSEAQPSSTQFLVTQCRKTGKEIAISGTVLSGKISAGNKADLQGTIIDIIRMEKKFAICTNARKGETVVLYTPLNDLIKIPWTGTMSITGS